MNLADMIVSTTIEAIAAAGPGGLPSGHLYVALQTHLGANFWTLQAHEALVAVLVRSGKVTCEHHLLRVVSP